MFGMAYPITGEFEIHKTYFVFGLAKLHALGSSTHYHSLITYGETSIGMDMTSQYNAKAIEPDQTTATDERFHFTGESMTFNGGVQDQNTQIRSRNDILWIDNSHVIQRIGSGRNIGMITQAGDS